MNDEPPGEGEGRPPRGDLPPEPRPSGGDRGNDFGHERADPQPQPTPDSEQEAWRERRYRRLLNAYPSWWRRLRGEEFLAVLVQGASDRGAVGPSTGEVIDIVGHGLLTRFGALPARLGPRGREFTAVGGLASLTALSLLCFLFGEWWPAGRDPGVGALTDPPWPGTFGPFTGIGGPLTLIALAPAAFAFGGWTRAARRSLAALLLILAAVPLGAPVLGYNRPALWALAGMTGFALLALTAPVRRRALLAGLTLALLAWQATTIISGMSGWSDPRPDFYYGTDLFQLSRQMPVAAVIAIAVATGYRAARAGATVASIWLAALAIHQHSAGDTSAAVLYLGASAALALGAIASTPRPRHTTAPPPQADP